MRCELLRFASSAVTLMSRRKQSFLQRTSSVALLVLILPFVLPLALVAIALHLLYRNALYLLVWTLWLPKGKDVLLVYSDSPTWQEYMATQVLPAVYNRAVVLNWSERKKWRGWSLAVAIFHHFGGGREFNPLVILFRPARLARVFRFWPAFQHWKRGCRGPVERLRQDLLSAL
jgi:hypothetical protein